MTAAQQPVGAPGGLGAAGRVSLPGRVLLAAISLYQSARAGRPSPCRFAPSCSAYAHEAVVVHGARRGGWMAVRRLGRCHPWGGQGWDPVPSGSMSAHCVNAHAQDEVEA